MIRVSGVSSAISVISSRVIGSHAVVSLRLLTQAIVDFISWVIITSVKLKIIFHCLKFFDFFTLCYALIMNIQSHEFSQEDFVAAIMF